MYLIDETNSSLIKEIEYFEDDKELTIRFKKYFVEEYTYIDVPLEYFIAFSEVKSMGRYYLQMIKTNFKLKSSNMADKPKTVNKAGNFKRFLRISIDVNKINNEWVFVGEKGNYVHMTLQLLPDGTLDKFGNLGMITQDVPKEVWEAEKHLKEADRSRGEILGNAAEFERRNPEGSPGSDEGTLLKNHPKADEIKDDLPF